MKRIRTRQSIASHRRSGLAPLELVMLAPLLVFMGALMVNFGDVALWKIRSQANVHYAMTQHQPLRQSSWNPNTQANPRPSSWPEPERFGGGGANDINQVQNQYWNQTNTNESLALMGNPIQDAGNTGGMWTKNAPIPSSPNFFEVDRTMWMERGVTQGAVGTDQTFPMLKRIINQDGRYRFDNEAEILSGDWNFGNLGLRANNYPRTFALYGVEPQDLPNFDQSLIQNFDNAVNEMRNSYASLTASSLPAPVNQHPIDPIDHDREWLLYTGGMPNFHPHPSGCELELRDYLLRDAATPNSLSRYELHLRSIRGLPRRMANAWISMYQNELDRQRGNPPLVPPQPPFPGGMNIPQLEAEISNLQRFRSALPQGY